ncbi:MAG: TIGR03087 family PEP-CTERM/XrtA system glycosyltransferase [Alphaproteobacteria bacterium]|nr:TIGR03087 family PEP-CTERM/XrtA system glycosyltransferase [Alphaproteobacteria bacterium]
MARILFLAHRIPYPPNKGDKIRSWPFLEHLLQNHTVHAGFYVDTPKDRQYVSFLEERCETVGWQFAGAFRQKLGMLWGLLCGKPLTTSAYPKHQLKQYVDGLLDAGEIDLIFLFSGAVATLIDSRHSHIPVITDLVDVDSAKWAQYSKIARFPMSWIYRREARLLAKFERQVAFQSRHTILVSRDEAALFTQSVLGTPSGTNVCAITNGVDIDHFSADRFASAVYQNRVIFTGAMDYQPNIEAVEWFVANVWPLVIEKCKDARFVIAGAPVHPRVAALAGANVEVLGFVQDMAQEIGESAVVVAPLQTARGIQNKVLEGMAMAKPVVATPDAKEGIEAEPGRDLIVAREPLNFAGEVVHLLTHPSDATKIGRSARKQIEKCYQWSGSLTMLDQLVAEIMAGDRK